MKREDHSPPSACRVSLLALVLGICGCALTSPSYQWVPSSDPRLQYEGFWSADGAERFSFLPGASLTFELRGSAELWVAAPAGAALRLVLEQQGQPDREWIAETSPLVVQSPHGFRRIRLQQVATAGAPFHAEEGLRKMAEYRVSGLRLRTGAEIREAPPPSGPLIEFIGDSIVCGAAIHGRQGHWWETCDLRMAFSARLARGLEAETRYAAYPGATLERLIQSYPRIRDSYSQPQRSAHWVILNVGANDLSLSSQAYLMRLSRLVALCAESNPDARILLLNFFRMSPDRLPQLRLLAQNYPPEKILVMDTRAYISGYSDSFVHPDPASHRDLVARLMDFIGEK